MKARIAFSLIFGLFGSFLSLVTLYILGTLFIALFLFLDKALNLFSNYTKSFLTLINLELFSGILGSLFIGSFLIFLCISLIYGYRFGSILAVERDFNEKEQNIIFTLALFSTVTFLILGLGFAKSRLLSQERQCARIVGKDTLLSAEIIKILDYAGDIENDGFDDYLGLDFLINSPCEGDFTIEAAFYDKEGNLVKNINERNYLKKGEEKIFAKIPREYIGGVVQPGKFVLKGVTLKGQYYNNSLKETEEIIIEKIPYYSLDSYGAPEARKGWITFEKIRDYGVDMDGNGLFEELVVEIEAYVFSDGRYQSQLILERGLQAKRQVVELKRGKQRIEISIPGIDIFERRINGPYRIRDFTFKLEQNERIDVIDEKSKATLKNYSTKEYNYRQFE